jgi:hypothetical protein
MQGKKAIITFRIHRMETVHRPMNFRDFRRIQISLSFSFVTVTYGVWSCDPLEGKTGLGSFDSTNDKTDTPCSVKQAAEDQATCFLGPGFLIDIPVEAACQSVLNLRQYDKKFLPYFICSGH